MPSQSSRSEYLSSTVSVQCWGDIIRSHPELLNVLLQGAVTAVAWTYEAPPAEGAPPPPVEMAAALKGYGIDLSAHRGFEENAAPFAEAGIPFWLSAGTSSWNSLLGSFDNTQANLLHASRTAVKLGATGDLVTDWGDNVHLQPPSISYPPIVYGGAVTWCAETNEQPDVAAAVDRYALDDAGIGLGRTIISLGMLHKHTGAHVLNASPLLAALCPLAGSRNWEDPTSKEWTRPSPSWIG